MRWGGGREAQVREWSPFSLFDEFGMTVRIPSALFLSALNAVVTGRKKKQAPERTQPATTGWGHLSLGSGGGGVG